MMDMAFMVVGIGTITLICGALFGPWGLCVLPAGLLLAWILDGDSKGE